jgi:hypothetical protein
MVHKSSIFSITSIFIDIPEGLREFCRSKAGLDSFRRSNLGASTKSCTRRNGAGTRGTSCRERLSARNLLRLQVGPTVKMQRASARRSELATIKIMIWAL